MRKQLLISMITIAGAMPAWADPPKIEVQKHTTENSKTTTATTPITKDISIGVQGQTTYTKPGKGPDGPEPGNQVGSSQKSSGAIIIQKKF